MPWIPLLLVTLGGMWPQALIWREAAVLGLVFLLARHAAYGVTVARNGYGVSYILYYIPGVLLYAGVLWASYRAHARSTVEWKGRKMSVGR